MTRFSESIHNDSTVQAMDLLQPSSGFNFDHVHRNRDLLAASSSNGTGGIKQHFKKTGTTIAGIVFPGGVVLGADTRATGGSEVAEKNCSKIHYLAPNIYCCGAGTAADTDKTNALISSQLELLRMDHPRRDHQSRVVTACTLLKRMLFRYQGHIGAHLILGGCDVTGAHLYQIHSHGSTSKLTYTTMGSGSLAAMAVMESSYREDLSELEAVALVQRAITAGIYNDLGSGSNCDICIIRLDGSTDYRRPSVLLNQVAPLRQMVQRSARLTMPPGVTPIMSQSYLAHPTQTSATLADVTIVTTTTAPTGGGEQMEVES